MVRSLLDNVSQIERGDERGGQGGGEGLAVPMRPRRSSTPQLGQQAARDSGIADEGEGGYLVSGKLSQITFIYYLISPLQI